MRRLAPALILFLLVACAPQTASVYRTADYPAGAVPMTGVWEGCLWYPDQLNVDCPGEITPPDRSRPGGGAVAVPEPEPCFYLLDGDCEETPRPSKPSEPGTPGEPEEPGEGPEPEEPDVPEEPEPEPEPGGPEPEDPEPEEPEPEEPEPEEPEPEDPPGGDEDGDKDEDKDEDKDDGEDSDEDRGGGGKGKDKGRDKGKDKCKPGWGHGDRNHCHSGPPGKAKGRGSR